MQPTMSPRVGSGGFVGGWVEYLYQMPVTSKVTELEGLKFIKPSTVSHYWPEWCYMLVPS